MENEYGDKLVEWSGYRVEQVWVYDLWDSDLKCMLILAYKNSDHPVILCEISNEREIKDKGYLLLKSGGSSGNAKYAPPCAIFCRRARLSS